MRIIALFVGLSLLAGACGSEENVRNGGDEPISTELIQNPNTAQEGGLAVDLPVMSFEKEEHDFGTIKQGDVVEYSFRFKNTGTANLLIQDATASCGCTVPTFPREPIKVGESGVIPVKFDSKGKKDNQNKTVTITANTDPNKTYLRIKCFIEADEKAMTN